MEINNQRYGGTVNEKLSMQEIDVVMISGK
jgi:hypothetical protein